MSARDTILAKIRNGARAGADAADRRDAVEARLAAPPLGIVPARGKLDDPEKRIALFEEMAVKANATVVRLESYDAVAGEVGRYLRERNLPASIRMGDNPRLAGIPWADERNLTILKGPSDGTDMAGVSHAFAGVAETGTVALHSGADDPTTINFLPEHHIVVIDAEDIAGDIESVWTKLRARTGRGEMPRAVNLITGPSRSADIEQTLLLGAHGPRALHLIVVG